MLDNFQLRNGGRVALSENEKIILNRMRDADTGSEYDMIFKGPAVPVDQQRFAPRDQCEPLVIKGLATYIVGVDGHGEFGIQLSADGRYVLDQIAPVNKTGALEEKSRQYLELTEDELIDLLAETAEIYAEHLMGIPADMAAMALALKKRRDDAAPARARIAEYLRHAKIEQDKYEKDIESDSEYTRRNARKPEQVLDHLNKDPWTSGATLLLSDVQKLVTPLVRDTEKEFFEEQAERLELWKTRPEYKKLPEKQKVLLEHIALGHVVSDYRGYRGQQDCCRDTHGSTIRSLREKRIFTTTRPRASTLHASNYLMLHRPSA